jgi:hypothetical protein
VEPGYFTVVAKVVVSLTGNAVSNGNKENLEVAIGAIGKRILPQSDGGWDVGLDIVTGWS